MTAATNHRRSAHSEHQDPEQKQTTTSLSHRVPYNQLPEQLQAYPSVCRTINFRTFWMQFSLLHL